MFTLEEIKQNLALSYVASSGRSLTNPTPSSIYEYIIESFRRSDLIDGNFDIVWGPAVLQIKSEKRANANQVKRDERTDDLVVYVARNIKNKDDYRVVIRGTVTTEDIFVDLDIDQTEWNTVDPNAPSGIKVSVGSSVACNDIIKGKSNNLPGKDLTLSDFISKLTPVNGGNVEVTFTGHSLGGCLAMTLALYYKSQFNTSKSAREKENIRINCCTFAAPTAGSKSFVEYAAKLFNADGKSKEVYQSKFLRVFDTNDLVPCAWVVEELKRFRNLYDGVSPVPDNMKSFLDNVISVLNNLPDEDKYTQPEPSLKFDFPLKKDITDWKEQASYQHSNSYPAYYKLVYKVVDLGSSGVGDIVIVEK